MVLRKLLMEHYSIGDIYSIGEVLDYKILNEDFAKKICGELREKNIVNLDEVHSKGPKIVGAERYDRL